MLSHSQGARHCVRCWDGVLWSPAAKSRTFGLVIRLFDVKQYLTNEKEQTEIISTTKITRFGSWNVRSCYRVTKRELIVQQLKRYKIEVAALAETNIPDSGIYVVNGYTFIYSGTLEKGRSRMAHGAAVCLGPNASRAWRNSGSIWKAVNSRIVTVRIKCRLISITVIAVYAPVNPSNGSKTEVEASDEFYKALQSSIDNTNKGDIILIMGDFNARVGVEQTTSAPSVVGKHTVDKQNQNGRRLVDFCLFNGFVITNTFFPHNVVHQTTWMHPKTKKWHMLDYVLVNHKFRNSIHDVRAHRGATGGIGTDHHLLRAKIRIHLKCRKKKAETNQLKLDYGKLNNEKVVAEFQAELLKYRNNTKKNSKDLPVNEKFTHFTGYLHEHSKKYFANGQKYQKNTKEWFTQEIAEIVNKKAKAYVEWQRHRGMREENKYRNEYRTLAKIVKNKVEARQYEYWEELSIEIENAVKDHDPATAFQVIRRLRGSGMNTEHIAIHDKDGNSLMNSEDRLNRWREYFEEMFNVETVVDEWALQQIPQPPLDPKELSLQDAVPTIEEVMKAIQQIKNRKAPGKDGIPIELLKVGGRPLAEWLHEIICDVWEQEVMIKDWTEAILIRLYKNKGDKRICDNYRGISLLVVAEKVFARILLNRVQRMLDKKLLEEQAGFRAGRSTLDQVFILRTVMERSREFNQPLHICFIDLQKAYDSVDRQTLWRISRAYGISDKMIRMIRLLYEDTRAKVRIDGDLSTDIQMKTGVKQGCLLSPILFNIYIDFVMRQVLQQAGVEGITMSYRLGDLWYSENGNGEDVKLLSLMYADDIAVMCQSIQELETFIKAFERCTQMFGLTMNIKKTCIMSLKQFQKSSCKTKNSKETADEPCDIIIRNQKIVRTDEFNYLGCCVSKDQTQAKDIETRVSKASNAFNSLRRVVWYRKCISIHAKMRIFRASVLPILLYGSELWSLTVAEEQRLTALYMRCLRTIIGVSITDRMKNDLVLQLTGQPPLENILRRNRLRWFGHVNRMNNDQNSPMLTKKTLFATFKNVRRPPHGVKLRWRDKIMRDLNASNITNWRRETQDRDKWRKIINRGVTYNTVHTDITRIVRDHKERAANRRAREEQTKKIKQNTNIPIADQVANTKNDDAKCTKCGRVCKNKKGLKIHQYTCIKKNAIYKNIDSPKAQASASTTFHRTTTSRPTKVIELLSKTNNNKYLCPNPTCSKLLKAQGATAHVKACAKSWLETKNIVV